MSGSYGARRTGRALSLLRKQKIGTRRAAGPFADRIGTLRDERSRCPSPGRASTIETGQVVRQGDAEPRKEDRLRVEAKTAEDVLKKIDIAFVVDQPMIDEIIVASESTVRRPGPSCHGKHESLHIG